MARAWPGNTSVDYLTIPASAVWNFNTDVCLMAVVRLPTYRSAGNNEQILVVGTAARGYGIGVSDINGILDLTHTGIANSNGTSTTALALNEWTALCLFCSTGAAATFKKYTYSSGVLATETNADTNTLAAPSTDAGRIGNWLSATNQNSFIGDIDRIAILQGRPTDNEFVGWAVTGRLPRSSTLKGYWLFWNDSPIQDLSGNGNAVTLTGTTLSPTSAPVGLFSPCWRSLPFLDTIITTPQLARPMADTTRDNWEEDDGTTTTIYDQLDETVADDADYIRTQLTPTLDVYVAQLGSLTDPVSSSGHTLRWRYGKDTAGGAAISLTVELREGYTNEGSQGTLIATAATLTDIGAGWTAGSYTLSGAEADAITAYSSLYTRLVADCPVVPSNPAIVNSATTSGSTATTTPVVNLPGSLVAGNLLVVLIRNASAGAIGWPDASWVELFDASDDAADDQMALAYHTVTGAEGSTITLSSGSGRFAAIAWQISGAEDITVNPPQLSTVATGSATEPNSTTVTPTGGSKTYLFGALFGMAGEQTGITAYPTSYTLGQAFITSLTAGAVGLNCVVGGAWRQATGATEDPSVWDVTGTLSDWTAYTVAVHPKATRRAQVSWLEFEVPEAPAVGGGVGPLVNSLLLLGLGR